MTQTDRDRLVALKKAKDKKITQRQAAEELGLSERQVRRLMAKLRVVGDKAVIHGLRGRGSNRKSRPEVERKAKAILGEKVFRGFGPTLASQYLAEKYDVQASKETVRHWMVEAGLWRSRAVAKPQAACGGHACMAPEAGTLWRVSPVGHQRSRLAGRPW